MDQLFGIWGFIYAIFLIMAAFERIIEEGHVFKYLIIASILWVIVAVVPCLAYYLIVCLVKLF